MTALLAWLTTASPARGRQRQFWTATLAGLSIFAVYAVIEWPGAFTADSILMAWQADGDAPLTSYHPVSVVALYRATIAIFGGAGPWIAQAAVMSVGFAVLWTLGEPSPLRRVLTAVLFISPPWLAMTATVGKDAIAVALVVVLAAVLMTRPEGRVAGPVALAAAVALPLVRFNAFPLCSLAVLIWPLSSWRLALRWRVAVVVLAGLGLSVGTQVASSPFSTYVIDTAGTFQAWDLAGISARTGFTDVIPAENRRAPSACTADEIRAQYSTETSDPLVFPDGACITITRPEDYGMLDQRKSEGLTALAIGWGPWINAVAAHPVPYLAHRVAVAGNLLGFSGINQVLTAEQQHPGIERIGGTQDPAPARAVTDGALGWSSRHANALWAPWIALVILAAATLLLARNPLMRKRSLLVGIASSTFTVITLVTIPGTDTRYMYPIVALAGLMLIFAVTVRTVRPSSR